MAHKLPPLRFGYDAPGGGTGIGAESAKWKFEIN